MDKLAAQNWDLGVLRYMAKSQVQSVALPRIVDLDALDEIRDTLLDALHAGPVEIAADKVERVSTNALFMLLSAAATAQKASFEFSTISASEAVRAASIAKLGLGAAFAPVLKGIIIDMRVLTVDDSRTILAMLHHTLTNAGFEVLQAENGQVGLDMLGREDVDVVITDINMPVMDGIEFIKQVRATGKHQSLPILILTTETSQDKRDQGRAAGGTGWIVKPFDPEKLICGHQQGRSLTIFRRNNGGGCTHHE